MYSFTTVVIFLSIIGEVCWAARNVIDICDDSRNKIYASVGASHFVSTKKTDTTLSKCNIQVMSCPACIITIKISLFGMIEKCEEDENFVNTGDRTQCNCDRIEITEPLHKVYSRKQYCASHYNGTSTNATIPWFTYRSQTRSLNILFAYSQEYEYPFSIELSAKYNIHHIELVPNPNQPDTLGGVISTPFFPMHYPSDLRVQYNILCLPRKPVQCRIKLVFTDHQLASPTILEIFESKKRRVGITTERIFRPPIVVSEGPSLSVNFYANKASNFGFKAYYTAVLGNVAPTTLQPKTVCGGLIKDSGGAITMISMTSGSGTVTYDCIWIIKPVQEHSDLKTHLFARVIEFSNMEGNAELEVHKGSTSSHRLLERIATNSTYGLHKEHVANINTGFYISLRGTFNVASRLVISYSTFSFSHPHELGIAFSNSPTPQDCYLSTDFLCHNHRCIHGQLRCDGLDHCGDFSDEQQCNREENTNQNWRLYSQNYYFPRMDSYSAIPAGLVIAFCTSFVTFFVCSLICSIVYRTKHQQDLNRRLRTISQIMGEQRTQERFAADNGLVDEPPPEYDFPPTYQDVVLYNTMKKVIHDSKNVQNLAIQTDLMGDTNAGCSRSVPVPDVIPDHVRPLRSSSEDDSSGNEEMLFVQCTSRASLNPEFEATKRHSLLQHCAEAVPKIKYSTKHRLKPYCRTFTTSKASRSVSNLLYDVPSAEYVSSKQLSRSADGLINEPKSGSGIIIRLFNGGKTASP